MSDASLFAVRSARTSILLKIKYLPQTPKASGVPEAFDVIL